MYCTKKNGHFLEAYIEEVFIFGRLQISNLLLTDASPLAAIAA